MKYQCLTSWNLQQINKIIRILKKYPNFKRTYVYTEYSYKCHKYFSTNNYIFTVLANRSLFFVFVLEHFYRSRFANRAKVFFARE